MEHRTLLLLAAGLVAAAGITVAALNLRGGRDLPLVDVPVASLPAASAPAGALNVVLVVACTVRQDQVAGYGGHPEVTPWLATFGDQGAIFEDPISPSPWTRPAVAGIVTGTTPRLLHMEEPTEQPNRSALPASAVTLADRFREGGWRTIGVSANPNVSAVFGFAQGFGRWIEVGPGPVTARASGAAVVARALEAVEPAGGAPLYLQLLLADAHGPHPVEPGQTRLFARLDEVTGDVQRYRVHLNQLDRALYALDRGLAERGYDATNTLLVVVNDHGEGLHAPVGHGRGHGRQLYPTTVGGVWMLRGPGIPADRRISGLSSLVDVAPTIAGLAGRPALDGADGRDWSALVRGQGDRTDRVEAWTETTWGRTNRAAVYTDDRICMRDFGPIQEEERGTGAAHFVQGCCERADAACRDVRADGPMEARIAEHRSELDARVRAVREPAVQLDPEMEALVHAFGYAESAGVRAGKAE